MDNTKIETTYGEQVEVPGEGVFLLDLLYDRSNKMLNLAVKDHKERIWPIIPGSFVQLGDRSFKAPDVSSVVEQKAVTFAESLLVEPSFLPALLDDVIFYLRRHVGLETRLDYKATAKFIIDSWIYDFESSCEHLIIKGATGSGKSTLANMVGLVCYRSKWSLGMHPSVIMFLQDKYGGTTVMDGGDLIGNEKDEDQDLVKFFNQGAMTGRPIWKSVETQGKTKSIETKSFKVYGPKIITIYPVFEEKLNIITNRSLTINMPMITHEQFDFFRANESGLDEEVMDLRNKLMRYRFDQFKQPEADAA